MSRIRDACGWAIVLAVASVMGCGEDPAAPGSMDDTEVVPGVVEVRPTMTQFEVPMVDGAGGGGFLLRGGNIRYEEGAFLLDLAVVNRTPDTYSEPVRLTFDGFNPDDILVNNPDNGEHGVGAMIAFDFANDDGLWTPDESSLARTVSFDAESGVTFAFSAAISTGDPIAGSKIGGVIWVDTNENGAFDEDEHAAPGVRVDLLGSGDRRETHSGPDGLYRFEELAPGVYTVRVVDRPDFSDSTPLEVHVVIPSGGLELLQIDFGITRPAE
jgi:hypothetical protein